MTASSWIAIGDDWRGIMSYGGCSPDLLTLFSESDLDRTDHWYGYSASAEALRQRLQVQGFTSQRAHDDLAKAVKAFLADKHMGEDGLLEIDGPVVDSQWVIEELTAYLHSEVWPHGEEPKEVEYFSDLRSYLRLVIDLVEPATTIRYELSGLLRHGFLQEGDRISEQARAEQLSRVRTEAPLIVLPEGSTDVRILKLALDATHPHLTNFITFMDLEPGGVKESKVEAGVQGAVKTLLALWRAGVANRIVVIVDNDTAAYSHLSKAKKLKFSDNIRLVHYPAIPLLDNYPSYDPVSGTHLLSNVNGLAGSLEMYLGENLLEVNGRLTPVEWGPTEAGKRQGTLPRKRKKEIREHFEAVAESPSDDPRRAWQDWTGVKAIIESIVTAFDVPQSVHNARDGSEAVTGRR